MSWPIVGAVMTALGVVLGPYFSERAFHSPAQFFGSAVIAGIGIAILFIYALFLVL